jgi:hypothetical protein
MRFPVEPTTPDQAELLDKIAHAFGVDDWWNQEGFEDWGWGDDPESPRHRPMLVVDKDMIFCTFTDGVLGMMTRARGGTTTVRAFRGREEDGTTIWETRIMPLRDPNLN